MKLTHENIIGELERLAEALPWEEVMIWVARKPEGEINFTAYTYGNSKMGLNATSSNSKTLADAVDELVALGAKRDPEIARQAKIRELQEQINQLQAVVIGMPPYVPGRELSNGEPCITVNETINV